MPDIRPELIEKAAKAIYEASTTTDFPGFDELPGDRRDVYLAQAECALEDTADDLRAEGAADDREQWARKVAQELATTSVQSAQYIGQMVTGTLDALLAMTRASALAEAKARALRESAELMRSCKEPGHWNLRDLLDPEVSYSPDVWLEVRADQIERGEQP